MITLTTRHHSKALPADLELSRVVGFDQAGRIVVNDFDAFNPNASNDVFLFGLTLCCNASDKGVEDGIVCRGCYGYHETGNYLFRSHGFPGFDPLTQIRVTADEYAGVDVEGIAALHDVTVRRYPKSVSLRGEWANLHAVHAAASTAAAVASASV